MRRIQRLLSEEDYHKDASMVVVNILAHGDDQSVLASADGQFGFYIPNLVGTLMDVKALHGKPKIFFFNSCRGDCVARCVARSLLL